MKTIKQTKKKQTLGRLLGIDPEQITQYAICELGNRKDRNFYITPAKERWIVATPKQVDTILDKMLTELLSRPHENLPRLSQDGTTGNLNPKQWKHDVMLLAAKKWTGGTHKWTRARWIARYFRRGDVQEHSLNGYYHYRVR